MTSIEAAIHEVGYTAELWREAIKTEVRDLLRLLKRVCEGREIPYFIVNGTLLGAVKFNPPGLIPWDDDADVAVYHEDVERLIPALQAALVTTPFRLIPAFYGYLIHGPNKGMLDLLVFMRDTSHNPPIYRMSYPLANGKPTFLMSQIRVYEFPETELLPLRPYIFEDFTLQGPADGYSICRRTYGSDVFEVNRRPDHGWGIHPLWPAITRALNPLSQGCVDWLAQHYPCLIEKLAMTRSKKATASLKAR